MRGTLSIEGASREVVLSMEQDRVPLCINSFSTPPGGVVLPVVDVGRGEDADFAGKDVKGSVVLGDSSIGQLWTRGVRDRGAAGVISTDLAAYTRPESTPDV
jgi:threonine dehydrogenase-like Zn-dependent dehydrogenase